MLKFLILLVLLLLTFEVKSQGGLSKTVFIEGNYHVFGVEGSTNSNFVLIHAVKSIEVEMVYSEANNYIDTTAWIYIIGFNLDSQRVIFENKHRQFDDMDIKEEGGVLSVEYRDYPWHHDYILSGDTVSSNGTWVSTETGKVIWTLKSNMFWRTGGSLYGDTCSKSVHAKNYKVEIAEDRKNVSFIRHDEIYKKENDEILTYSKGKTYYNFSQQTNLLSDNYLTNEFFSYHVSYGSYVYIPLNESLFIHHGSEMSFHSLRLTGNKSLIDDVEIEKHRARLFSVSTSIGITKTFGENNRWFFQIQIEGGLNAYARYTYWDVLDGEHKRKKSVLNRYAYGSKIIVGKSRLALTSEYRFSNLFKSGIEAQDATPFSIGVEWEWFHYGRGGYSDARILQLR